MSNIIRYNQQLRNLQLGLISLAFVGITACADSSNKAEKTDKSEAVKEQNDKKSNLFEVEGKVFSIPSPIQTALLLKEVGTAFDAKLLNPINKEKSYTTSYKKALNLGVYAADLGYATIYDQSQAALSYMAVTRKLSHDMGISGVFSERLVKQFENSIGNQDSLLRLVSDAFKKTDSYLKENKEKDISVMVLAGGWIEILHLATKLSEEDQENQIRQRIAEQKITVKNLIKLLLPYRETPVVGDLVNHLNELKDIYSEIKFTYNFRAPETIPEQKKTIIRSESNVEISDAQLQAISAKVSEIRNGIIN